MFDFDRPMRVPIHKNIDLVKLYESCEKERAGLTREIPQGSVLDVFLSIEGSCNPKLRETLRMEIAKSAKIEQQDKLALLVLLDLHLSRLETDWINASIGRAEAQLANRTAWSPIIEEKLGQAYETKRNFLAASRLFNQAAASFENLGAHHRSLSNDIKALQVLKKANPQTEIIEKAQCLLEKANRNQDWNLLCELYILLSQETYALGLSEASEVYAENAIALCAKHEIVNNLLDQGHLNKIRSMLRTGRHKEAKKYARGTALSSDWQNLKEDEPEWLEQGDSRILSKLVLGTPLIEEDNELLDSLTQRNLVRKEGNQYRYSIQAQTH